jgi:hypothetical protein
VRKELFEDPEMRVSTGTGTETRRLADRRRSRKTGRGRERAAVRAKRRTQRRREGGVERARRVSRERVSEVSERGRLRVLLRVRGGSARRRGGLDFNHAERSERDGSMVHERVGRVERAGLRSWTSARRLLPRERHLLLALKTRG